VAYVALAAVAEPPWKVMVHESLLPGVLGTWQEMGRIAESIRRDRANTDVEALADLLTYPTPSVRREEFVDRLRYGLVSPFHYQGNPPKVEKLCDPIVHVWRIANRGHTFGDCKNMTALSGALASSAGIPIRLHAMKTRGEDGPFTHVRAEALTLSGWRSLDFQGNSEFPGHFYRRV